MPMIGRNSDTNDSVVNMPYYIGLKATVTEGSGVARYIEALYNVRAEWTGWATGGLYEYLDYSTNFAGNIIQQAETRTNADMALNTSYVWYRFYFRKNNPILIQGKTYYIVVCGSSTVGGYLDLNRLSGMPGTSWGTNVGVSDPMKSPMTGESASSNTYNIRLWYEPFIALGNQKRGLKFLGPQTTGIPHAINKIH